MCYIKAMILDSIQKLINGVKLDFTELREVFEEIFSGCADEIQTTSFLTALQNLDFDENVIQASILSSKATIKPPHISLNPQDSIQNIILDNYNSQIFPVEIAMDLICASNGLSISRYAFADSFTNSQFEFLKKLGINFSKNIDYDSVEYEKLNFYYFYLSDENPYCKYAEKLRRKLPFCGVLDITSKMLNPLKSDNLFLGINDINKVDLWAKILLELGYSNSLIVSCENNLPFICPNGVSKVAEAWKNKIFSYTITPDLLGMEEFSNDEIMADLNVSLENFKDILNGKNDTVDELVDTMQKLMK